MISIYSTNLNHLYLIKSKKGNNPIPYRYEYSTSLPGQASPRIYDQRGGFYTPNDTNEDGSYDVSLKNYISRVQKRVKTG